MRIVAVTATLLLVMVCMVPGYTRRTSKKIQLEGLSRNIRMVGENGEILLNDDPLFSVQPIFPQTKIGNCECDCCTDPPARELLLFHIYFNHRKEILKFAKKFCKWQF